MINERAMETLLTFFFSLIYFKVIGFVIFPIVQENEKQLDRDNVLNRALMIAIVEVDIDHVYVISIVECHVSNEVNAFVCLAGVWC